MQCLSCKLQKEQYYVKKLHKTCLSQTQVFEWFKRLKERRETTEEDAFSGQSCVKYGHEHKKMVERVGLRIGHRLENQDSRE